MTKETILADVQSLIGRDLDPTRAQLNQLDTPQADVDAIMRGLPLQIADLRHEAAQAIAGLDAADIHPHEVAPLLVLDRHVTGFSSNREDFILKQLGPMVIYQIGLRKGKTLAMQKASPPAFDLVKEIYRELLGRVADNEGFQHYQDMLDAGTPVHVVVRNIELSPEALDR
ncbi:MAG: DUF4214 domain-containing protein [Sulfitobacter sp.]